MSNCITSDYSGCYFPVGRNGALIDPILKRDRNWRSWTENQPLRSPRSISSHFLCGDTRHRSFRPGTLILTEMIWRTNLQPRTCISLDQNPSLKCQSTGSRRNLKTGQQKKMASLWRKTNKQFEQTQAKKFMNCPPNSNKKLTDTDLLTGYAPWNINSKR